MGMRPHLMGLVNSEYSDRCDCGGMRVVAIVAWEVDKMPMSVQKTLACVECGTYVSIPRGDHNG